MELSEIKEKLPKGWVKIVSVKSGYSKSSVYHWINGRRKNEAIKEITLEYLAERLEKSKRLTQRIKKAIV